MNCIVYLHIIYLTYIFCANGANLTAEMGSEGSIAWPEWERWHFHEKISKVPPKMVPTHHHHQLFHLSPSHQNLFSWQGLKNLRPFGYFRVMNEPWDAQCMKCLIFLGNSLPSWAAAAVQRVDYRPCRAHRRSSHTRIQKAKRFQKILCRAVVTYKRLTSNCKDIILVFAHRY